MTLRTLIYTVWGRSCAVGVLAAVRQMKRASPRRKGSSCDIGAGGRVVGDGRKTVSQRALKMYERLDGGDLFEALAAAQAVQLDDEDELVDGHAVLLAVDGDLLRK